MSISLRRLRWLPAILIFLIGILNLSAEAGVNEPRLEADPLSYYFADGFEPSNWRSQLELAYWASGDSGWEAAGAELSPAIDELTALVARMDAKEKGEAVLEFMHERYLSRYIEPQSRLDVLFSTGRYNCLSSAVLYTILGTAVGLEVSGVSVTDHAFCLVRAGGQEIDVETTNPYGFDPGTKIEFQNAFGEATGFVYVPPGNYRNRSSLNILQLFSLLLQNRIADAEASGLYADAVGLAVDRWVLLGSGSGMVFEDLITRMLNNGALLSRSGREEEALSWAERGIRGYGPHPKWDDFVDGVTNNLLIKLLRQGRLTQARSRLDSLSPRLSPAARLDLDLMVSDSEIIAALEAVKDGGSEADFTAALDYARGEKVLSVGRIREIELNWRLYTINNIAGTEGWAAAWEAAEEAVRVMGESPQLQRASRIYRENYKAQLYNAAVAAYNSRNFDTSLSLINEAIIEFPTEPVFQSLLRNIEDALGRRE